jgi:hypothetical protein
MRKNTLWTLAAVIAAFAAAPLMAQQSSTIAMATDPAAPATEIEKADDDSAVASISTAPAITMQYFRAPDQRGINVFEAPKVAGAPYTGFRLDWGAAFAQQFQGLSHTNTAVPSTQMVNGQEVNRNALMDIGWGFNNATANLFLNAQIAPGMRVALTTYLSSRRHPEAWVKDGYFQIDQSPIDLPVLNTLMQYTTLRIGHMEVNYGDAHFRRSDNGSALYNPFIGNYIMDAFTTEVGAEVYLRHNGFMVMGGMTGGEIKGRVDRPADRGPSFLAKAGFDRQMTPDLRMRLMGSAYTTERSISNTLYGGDRAGSRYYFVMENQQATEAANGYSGLVNPGLRNSLTALQLNPFIQFRGFELFGVVEQATGRSAGETEDRTWNQYAVDGVYRFLDNRLFAGARYNTVGGPLQGSGVEVNVDRVQIGGGWFITPNLLMKGEWVSQNYRDFPTADIRHGGNFRGFVMEGVVAF